MKTPFALKTKFAAALCAASFVAVTALAQSPRDLIAALMKTWSTPTAPFQMIGNIYYVGTEGLASYLVKTSDGLILIDTAMPDSTALITDSIGKLGFKVSDIKMILSTHGHLDHTGGFAQIKKESGAQMIAGARDKPLLESGTYPGAESDDSLKFPPVSVDRTVADGDKVTLGDTTLIAHATPGHSPGCTSWDIKVVDGAATRDVLFFCSGTVALNKLVGKPTHPGIVADYRATFAKLKTMNPDVLLAPHPEMYGMQAKRAAMKDGAPNPFVKPGELKAYVEKLEQDFDVQLARQEAALKAK